MRKLTEEAWLKMTTKEYDVSNKALDEIQKTRRKREFILIITCLLAVIYVYPVINFDKVQNIKIPAISLDIPIKEAIIIFPTIIAAIYLIYLSSAIKQSILMGSAFKLE